MANNSYINLFGVQAFWTPYVSGAFGTEEEFGLIDELSTSFAEEAIKHTSRQCGSVGIPDRTASASIEITGSLVTPEISPRMIARAFKGKLTEAHIADATATEKSVTIVAMDIFQAIGTGHLSNVEVWDTTGQTGVQYVETTDYVVDYTRGTIRAVTGGAISAADAVFITFDNKEYNDWKVAGFTSTAAQGKLRVIACAVEDGMDVEYVFELVSLSMDGDYNIISAEDFLTMPLKIDVLSDNGITDPNKSKTVNIYGKDTITPDGL